MGQNANPNVLRLGLINEWKSKYHEKKSLEMSQYVYKELEIKKLINEFFCNNGLIINYCKIYYSENSLYIYVSFVSNVNIISLINKENKTQKLKKKQINVKTKKYKNKKRFLKTKIAKYTKYKQNLVNKNKISLKSSYYLEKKLKRIELLNYYKKHYNLFNNKNINHVKNNFFIKNLLESIQLLTNRQIINLNLTKLNTNFKILQTFSKKKKKSLNTNIIKLGKFKNNTFFKEGINICYNTITNEETTDLLANYIAKNIKNLKKHNFFLVFINKILNRFLFKNFSKIQKIQIKIKGRFNGALRAKEKTITVNKNLPLSKLDSHMSYSETTSYNNKGSFGIKIWMYYNN